MFSTLYSVIAFLITLIVTQILQLCLYEDIIKNDLKRKTSMIKRNMLLLDPDFIPLYKIKVKRAFSKIKIIRLYLPLKLRLYKGKI